MDLIDTLRVLPQVEEAQEVAEGEQKKIQITLSVKSELEKHRNILNTKINRMLS